MNNMLKLANYDEAADDMAFFYFLSQKITVAA